MNASRRQFLCGDVYVRVRPPRALRESESVEWPVKAGIGAACIALKQVVCRSCGDACETHAIRFKLRAGDVAVPKIEIDTCTGCGACYGACPVGAIAMRHSETGFTA